MTLTREDELMDAAQKAGERRLAYCTATLYEDPDGVGEAADFPGEESAGPYCGCDTCIVREVLAAGWPHMLELAKLELAPLASLPPGALRAKLPESGDPLAGLPPEALAENRCTRCGRSLPRGRIGRCTQCSPARLAQRGPS